MNRSRGEDWGRETRPLRFDSHHHNKSDEELLLHHMESNSRHHRRPHSKRYQEPSPRTYRPASPLAEEQHLGDDFGELGWQPHHAYRARGRRRPREYEYESNVNNWPPRPSPREEHAVVPRQTSLERPYADIHDPYRDGDSWFDKYERRDREGDWSPNRHRSNELQDDAAYSSASARRHREEHVSWDRTDWHSTGTRSWDRPRGSPQRAWATRDDIANSTLADRSWEPSSSWQNSRSSQKQTSPYKASNSSHRKKWSTLSSQRDTYM